MRFVECTCGQLHWGPFGAAGLLLHSRGRVLVQHRSVHVHGGACWGVPGGALDEGETPVEAALREAQEEVDGLPAERIRVVGQIATTDHLLWRYTTVVAHLDGVVPLVSPRGWESTEVSWISAADVASLRLHPAFAASWPVLLPRLSGWPRR